VTCNRAGGTSWTWRRSRTITSAAANGDWQLEQIAGRCSITASGIATSRKVSPRWPICPPGFLPLRRRRLLVFRPKPSLDGGLLLLWLSLASRASNSCTRACSTALCASTSSNYCWRCETSSSSSAMRASAVMPSCYTTAQVGLNGYQLSSEKYPCKWR
jgi:hypothetical protein